jgi:hypothetical protein
MLTAILALASVSSFAQNSAAPGNKLDLKQGQTITAVTESDMSMDMGMGGEIKNSNKATMVMNVVSADGDNATVTYSITKMSMNMEMMGNETKYDSENPADNDSEIGKTMADKIGKKDTGTINLSTGAFTQKSVNEEDNNPIGKIMSGGSNSNSFSTAFFMLDRSKKTGDTWTVNESAEGSKTATTYKLRSINGDEAIIDFQANTEIDTEVEMQGMQMTLKMTNKSNGDMTVDMKKNMVKKNNSKVEIEGNIEVMGQQSPISATGTTVTTFN